MHRFDCTAFYVVCVFVIGKEISKHELLQEKTTKFIVRYRVSSSLTYTYNISVTMS